MAEDRNSLMVEILRRLQADMAELKEGQRTANVHLAAIENHMAGFHLMVGSHTEELSALRQRIERIERRLELSDAPNP